MLAASVMLGGLLPLDAHMREQWPPSGAWRLPVGDPYTIATVRPSTPGPFFVLRSVEWDGFRASHQGADLGCGKAGLPVRAAAAGLVVEALDHGEYGGYGTHVVLAHRLPGGVLAYTVYAHLRIASLRVHAGQRVQAGQVLGRVGMTGHATAPHLHFELRSADDAAEPWEFGRVEDPLAFVEERLPTHRADTTGTEAVLEWGECAALLPPGAHSDNPLTREAWWRMLAAAVRGPALDPALDAGALRDSLIVHRILPQDASAGHTAVDASWHEVARDLARARRLGVRSGTGPLRSVQQRQMCENLLGTPTPALHTGMLSGRDGRPTLAQAVVMLSDVAGPRPEPPAPAAPVVRPVHRRMGPYLTPTDSAHGDSLRVAAAARARTARAARARRARADSARADSARADSLGREP